MLMSYKMKRIFFNLTVKSKHMQKVKIKKLKELETIEKELKVARRILDNLQFHGFHARDLMPLNKKLDLIKENIDETKKLL